MIPKGGGAAGVTVKGEALCPCRMKLALQKMGEVSKKQQEHTRDVRFLQQKLVKIKQVSFKVITC